MDPVTGQSVLLINRTLDYTSEIKLHRHWINQILHENEHYYNTIWEANTIDTMFFTFNSKVANVREGTPVTDMHDSDLPSPWEGKPIIETDDGSWSMKQTNELWKKEEKALWDDIVKKQEEERKNAKLYGMFATKPWRMSFPRRDVPKKAIDYLTPARMEWDY